MNQLTSETISFARFPLAAMVVLDHAFVSGIDFFLPVSYTNMTAMDVYNLIRFFGSYVFSTVSVPIFFLFSGYLFFINLEKWNWAIWMRKIKSRWHTLVIPYILWCFLYFFYVPFRESVCYLLKGLSLYECMLYLKAVDMNWSHFLWDSHIWGGQDLNWLGEQVAHSTGPMLGPFWFVRDLIVVTFLTPIIFFFIQKMSLFYMLFVGLSYLSGVWPDIHGVHSVSLFYFSLGACYAIKERELFNSIYKYRCWLYILYIILIPILLFSYGQETTYGISNFYRFIASLAMICFFFYLVNLGFRKNDLLTNSCFFIYAFHFFILCDCDILLSWIVGMTSPLQLVIVYLLKTIFTVVLCVLCYSILGYFCPRVRNVLCGSR